MSTAGRVAVAKFIDRDDSAVVCADRVVRRFGSGTATITAVRGVTATVVARARIALTGPSGSGKTTLLHLLAGLDTPTEGAVRWPGVDRHGTAGHSRVGVVFQGPSLISALDVVENVCLPLLFIDCAEGEATARAMDALDRLGIAELAHALPDELSGGQAQRVAIARVLAAGPRLILADEPTGQLDQDASASVIDVLLRAADDLDAALIVSTHDAAIAQRLPTEWTMHDGRLHSTVDGDDNAMPR